MQGSIERRYDLDALRAIAMLLGIVLHAALSFAPIPWSVQDSQQSSFYYGLFAAIHGFRMPLFFMISGFFTAMLWRKRGLGGLIKQRCKRILIPLSIGCLTIVPAMWAVTIFVTQPSESQSANSQAWDAVFVGDVDRVRDALANSEIELNSVHSVSGTPMLASAVFLGHTDLTKMLIDAGADVNQRSRDGSTALHSAAFVGRGIEAGLLVDAGADTQALDGMAKTPAEVLKIDFGTTRFLAASYGVQLEEGSLKAGRAEVAEHLNVTDFLGSSSGDATSEQLAALGALFFQLPVFWHLWFLWFLCWLVAAFAIYALLADRLGVGKLPKRFFSSPACLLWLIPLTALTQTWMQPNSFGPDVSIGLLPLPHVLAYYAVFFFFGVLYWETDDSAGRLGKGWKVMLPVALIVVFPFAFDLTSGIFGIAPDVDDTMAVSAISSLLQSTFAWLMILGSIGMFYSMFSGESKMMRYISDSSYWLYLIHMPVVLLAQWLVRDWQLPASIKFIGITVVVSALLLMTYEYFVRYTIIGRVLNGPRQRSVSEAVSLH